MSVLGIADIIGTAMTNAENHNQHAYNLKFQKEENAKTREYNLQLAKMQNGWNIQQWNRENAYNHPAAQKARLESAGLNADMMYGGAGVSNTSASSPQMTSGAPAAYQDWSGFIPHYMAPSFSNILDNQLKQAQIDNVNADTEKKGHEASILASDASYRDAWNRGVLETQNVTISFTQAQTSEKLSADALNKQSIKESQVRIGEIEARTQEIGANIQSIFNSINNDNARLELEKAFSKSAIERNAAACSLDYASAKNISEQLEKILRQYDDNHSIAGQQIINLGHDGKILLNSSKEAEFKAIINTYEGWDSDMTFYQNASKFVLQLLNGLSRIIPGARGLTNNM